MRQALEQAIAAMREAQFAMRAPIDDWKGELERKGLDAVRAAIRAAEAALAEPAAEPVAWHVVDESGDLMHAASWREAAHEHINDAINEHGLIEAASWRMVPVYAHPPARRPLTDDEIDDLHCEHVRIVGDQVVGLHDFARAVERAHGIKW